MEKAESQRGYLTRDERGRVATQPEVVQANEIARDRYDLTVAELDAAVREHQGGRLAALKRVFLG